MRNASNYNALSNSEDKFDMGKTSADSQGFFPITTLRMVV